MILTSRHIFFIGLIALTFSQEIVSGDNICKNGLAKLPRLPEGQISPCLDRYLATGEASRLPISPFYSTIPSTPCGAANSETGVETPIYGFNYNSQSLIAGDVNSLPYSDSCGPGVKIAPIRYLKPIVLSPISEPIRDLGTPDLPPPTVISNKCSCTKIVQKPQLYQRIIQVQSNQRFLRKSVVPRLEKISYCAKPRC